MPVGSLIIEFELPKNPSESSIPKDTFYKLVHQAICRHLSEWNIQPTRFQWIDQPDTPDDPADAPEFIRNCFSQAGIDSSAINPMPIGKMRYCLVGTSTVCYSGFVLNWTNPNIPNPFRVQIPLGNGKAVTADLTCMLSVNQFGSA